MLTDLEDLARQLAACGQLRTAHPSPAQDPHGHLYSPQKLVHRSIYTGFCWAYVQDRWSPHLGDPATVGCLRALIDGYRGSTDRGNPGRPEWLVLGDPFFGGPEDLGLYGKGDTEAAAIARLLLRQWGATLTAEQISAREERRRTLLQELNEATAGTAADAYAARIEAATSALDEHDKRWRL